jgi:hypothetical protein
VPWPPCRPIVRFPEGRSAIFALMNQVALVAERDLSGPLYDLVTAVLAIGEAAH